ncbi:MAG TPA: thiamine-phosphate kinase, partial [Rhizomicrobium sp.]
KGATPASYLLNLSLPGDTDRKWLEAFARGLAEDQEHFGIGLLGGDTGRVPGPCSISITAFGHVAEGRMIRRTGARLGEHVFVTGNIGDSGGGLAVLKGEGANISAAQRDALVARYRLPQPRLDLDLQGVASAALDISDGLIADMGHLAQASNVKLVIDAKKIPRSQALRALWGDGEQAILRAATAGDDYEIGFTAAAAPEGCTLVGVVTEGSGVELVMDGKSLPVPNPGYRHF